MTKQSVDQEEDEYHELRETRMVENHVVASIEFRAQSGYVDIRGWGIAVFPSQCMG